MPKPVSSYSMLKVMWLSHRLFQTAVMLMLLATSVCSNRQMSAAGMLYRRRRRRWIGSCASDAEGNSSRFTMSFARQRVSNVKGFGMSVINVPIGSKKKYYYTCTMMLLIYKHKAKVAYKCDDILSACVITNLISCGAHAIALWLV